MGGIVFPWSCCAVFGLNQIPDIRQQRQECSDVQRPGGGGRPLGRHHRTSITIMCGSKAGVTGIQAKGCTIVMNS